MIPPHLLPLVVWIPIALGWLFMRWRSAGHDAEHQRADNEHLRGINTGLRYDLMATRSLLDGAVEAKRALRRRCRGLLGEARRWKARALAAERGAP